MSLHGQIALLCLIGSRRFKTYVGNRVSSIVEQFPPKRWNHVIGVENPADCASCGILPFELLEHKLWWDGPPWLRMDSINRLLSTTFYYRPRQIHVIIIIIYKHIRECTESFLIKWTCIYFGKLFCLTFLLKLE